jgi:diphthamide synthase (EF-2-diphthine--ammonia ligase)
VPKALIAWSSGKDSAWALQEIRHAGGYEIAGALTTVTEHFARVSMHGVREELLHSSMRHTSGRT